MDFSFFQGLNISEELLQTGQQLLIVLGIGILVGLEREYAKAQKKEEGKELFAGVRTVPLVALIGYLSLYLADRFSYGIFVAALAGTFLLIGISYYFSAQREKIGATTEFSLIFTFLLGSLVYTGSYLLAVILAVVLTSLLTLKLELHAMVRKLSGDDILSIIKFVVITAMVLPILPDTDFGPYGALNPRKTWLIVVIFVSINFVGYFLSKFIERKDSILVTGILGGFASSTATSWYFSHQGGKNEARSPVYAAAIILASSIMFPRMLIWLALLNRALLSQIWGIVLIMAAGGIGWSIWILRKYEGPSESTSPREYANPINLKDALIFAAVYIGVLLLVGFSKNQFGDRGVYLASAISGLTDIDAITISLSNLGGKDLSLRVVSAALLVATMMNTLIKYIFCLLFGSTTLKRMTSWFFIPVFLLGVGYVLWTVLG